MQWRLTLDVPYQFPVEPGFIRGVACADFHEEADAHNNTFRDPVTGVVMLKPSFESRDAHNDFRLLNDFRYNRAFWRATKHGPDQTPGMTSILAAGSDPSTIEILVNVAIVLIEANASEYDHLKWALETNFTLDVDEGFGLEFYGFSAEDVRKNNWFFVQWSNIGIHFSQTGVARVYQFDRQNLMVNPALVHEFKFGSPSELMQRRGYFRFIPIPTMGLLVYFYTGARHNDFASRNVGSGVSRGHLIPWDTFYYSDRQIAHLFEASPVRIALNPYQRHSPLFQNIRFPTSGSYTDSEFDPGYPPSQLPATDSPPPGLDIRTGAKPQIVPSLKRSIYAYLQKAKSAGPGGAQWAPGDRAGRITAILLTDDQRYTPFLSGLACWWDPQFQTRNTTPLVLDRQARYGDTLQRIEFSQDAYGRFEGKATMALSSARGKAIADRGDATFLLEYSSDSGAHWTTLEGGLAVEWSREICFAGGQDYYLAQACLRDMFERLREGHKVIEAGFDELSIGDTLDHILRGGGLPALKSRPDILNQVKLPAFQPNQGFRFGPREGESLDEIARQMMIFLRQQRSEWRMKWDWAGVTMVVEKRGRDTTNFWSLKTKRSDENAAMRTWSYMDGAVSDPEPPEANMIQAQGLSRDEPRAYRVLAEPVNNYPSQNDPSSPDYLGRVKLVSPKFWPISDRDELNKMARRVYAAIAFRRDKLTGVPIAKLQLQLAPDVRVKLYDTAGAVKFDGWIHRRTVVADQDDKETMTLDLDTVWETPIA